MERVPDFWKWVNLWMYNKDNTEPPSHVSKEETANIPKRFAIRMVGGKDPYIVEARSVFDAIEKATQETQCEIWKNPDGSLSVDYNKGIVCRATISQI